MATILMNPIDAAFLLGESDSNLMHVAGLNVYRLPSDTGREYVHQLIDEARCYTTPVAPFNRQLDSGMLSRLLPRWEILKEVDLEFHLQHHALPWPGTQRELGILVSRLHSIKMDRSRPLWEVHFIEGLEDGRLALYAKIHHALADGVATMRIARRALSSDPDERGRPPFWAYRAPRRQRPSAEDEDDAAIGWTTLLMEQVLGPLRGAQAQIAGAQAVARMYTGLDLAKLRRTAGDLAKPYTAPRSILNSAITYHRRVSTQSYELARIRGLAEKTGGTVNDVILAICAGGLRRYLAEIGELPDKSLIAGMPMSFRPKDSDEAEGNATTMALASLATDIADVRQRFAAIAASTAEAKDHMSRMPRAAIMAYTTLLMAPFGMALVTGMSSRITPMFNVVISNVPGPSKPLYYNGAQMEEWYPVSIPLTGQALNITVLSYVDRMNFSFTACSRSLPHIQRLAPYCGEALTELEKEFAG